MLNQYFRASSNLEQALGRAPSVKEIAAELEILPERLADLLKSAQFTASLDHPVRDDSAFTLYDTLSHSGAQPDDLLMKESVTKEVADAMKLLNQRERELLALYFGLHSGQEARLEDIAATYGLSVEHTRRLKDAAIAKLRKSKRLSGLRSCLA